MTTIQSNTVDQSLLNTMNGTTSSTSAAKTSESTFLNLLVTQMKNQDPLNPMDNAQVTSQMAQLSTMSGIEKLNASFAALSSNMQASQNLQAANMIGHGVMTAGNSLPLSSAKGIYAVDLPQGADKVEVVIKDAAGATVRKLSLGALPAGVNDLTWDGKNDSGAAVADGTYTFDVAASSGEKALDVTKLCFGMVNSVSSGSQGVKLTVSGVGEISMADVKQIF